MRKKGIFLLFLCLSSLEIFAQGHSLCSDSAAFRKTIQVLDEGPFSRSVSAKIRANEILNEEDLEVFYAAYESVIVQDAKEIDEWVNLNLRDRIGCVDHSMAMRYVLEDGSVAAEAIKSVENTRPLEFRSASTVRKKYDPVVASILDGNENIKINDIRITAKTRRIVRELGRSFFAKSRRSLIKDTLEKLLDPEQHELLIGETNSKGLYTTYNTFKDMSVGEVKILFYQYRPILAERNLKDAFHAVLIQRISPDEIILYNTFSRRITQRFDFFPAVGQPWKFEEILSKPSINKYNSIVKKLFDASSLPQQSAEEAAFRLARIEKVVRSFESHYGLLPNDIYESLVSSEFDADWFELSSLEIYGFYRIVNK